MSVVSIPVIGLKGKAKSGKSLVAQMLIDRFRFREFTFAMPFKHFIANVYGCTVEQLDTYKTENIPRHDFTSRQAYQTVGEAFRSLDPNTWCAYLERQVSYVPKVPGIVISDVRRINEEATVRGLTDLGRGGFILEILRNEADQGEEFRKHVSEIEANLVNADAELHNDSTIFELEVAVDKFMKINFPAVEPHGRIGEFRK